MAMGGMEVARVLSLLAVLGREICKNRGPKRVGLAVLLLPLLLPEVELLLASGPPLQQLPVHQQQWRHQWPALVEDCHWALLFALAQWPLLLPDLAVW